MDLTKRRIAGLPMFAGGLLLLAVGLFLVGGALPSAKTAVVGGNIPVDSSATHQADVSAHNSPSVARDPRDARRLVVAARVEEPSYSCSLDLSDDGGASWTDSALPLPPGGSSPVRCYAPDVAFSANGVLYASFVTVAGLANTPDGVWVVASPDGGRTFWAPTRVSGPLAYQVRIATDPSQASDLYVSWVQARAIGPLFFVENANPIVVSRSTDGGKTWSAPAQASAANRNEVLAPSLVVGPHGDLHLLYLDVGRDPLDYSGGHQGAGGPPAEGPWSLVLARSDDSGRTWSESTVDSHVIPTQRFVAFVPPTPSLAMDGRGDVYVAFEDGRSGDPDVWLWASADSGVTFSPGVRVNDTHVRDKTSQYLPRLGVAPGGRLDVLYYDRRADPKDVMNEVSLQSSSDHGRTFSARTRVSDRAFDSRIGPGADRGMADLGSRLALVSDNRRVVAVWTDTRAGAHDGNNKQDLSSAAVELRRGSSARGPIRTAALLGLVAALGAVAWAAVGRQGARGPVQQRRERRRNGKYTGTSGIPQEPVRGSSSRSTPPAERHLNGTP